MSRARERGQAAVEFTLTIAVVLALVLGIFDLGRAFFAYDFVAHAARLATRYAIVNAAPCASAGTTAACEQAVSDYVKTAVAGIDPAKLSFVFTWQSAPACGGVAQPGCAVGIEVDYAFAFVALPLGAQTIKSSSQMIISQ